MLDLASRWRVRSVLIALACVCQMAHAQATATAHFDLPSQSLADSLRAIGSETKTDVLFNPKLVAGMRAPALKADLTAQEAIRQLLKGTGLRYELLNSATVIVTDRKVPASPASRKLPSRTTEDGPPRRQEAASQNQTEVPTQNQTEVAMLQEVVVTAQKREERLHDVPMGVTAITSGDIQTQRLLDFADLESKVPGLSVGLAVPGYSFLTIRGETVGGSGSTVATYLDDVPFGSSNALANGELLTGDFDTWDLQRVEVLRGPQGTLYGASSEGGVFKYVTNLPKLNQFASAFELGDEDVAHGDTGPSYKVMLNFPLGGIAAFRLDGDFTHLPGFIDNTQLDERDVGGGYREGGRASFLLDPSDNLSIRLTAFNQTVHDDGLGWVDVVGAAGTPLTPPANQLQPDFGNYDQHTSINQSFATKYDIYSGAIDWNLGWGTLTAITGYQTIDWDLSVDGTPAYAPFLAVAEELGVLRLPPGTSAGADESADTHLKKVTQEVRLASATGGALEWQVGGFFTRESSESPETTSTFTIPTEAATGAPALVLSATNAVYREWSAFGQITYHFDPAFDVALGGRWSENKQSEYFSESSPLLPFLIAPTVETQASTGTDFLYSVAPRWHLSQNTMTYVRVATGYRPGGPNEESLSVPASIARTYKSDSTINYEMGAKSDLLANRLSIDVALFLIDWRDIQVAQQVGIFHFTNNGGSATSRGLEWSFGLTPVDGLSWTLTGSYVDAYLTSNAVLAGGYNGDQLPYAPKWSNSVDVSYAWKAFADYRAFTGATWSYIGSRVSEFETTGTGIPEPRAELGAYNTINLRAGLDNGRWSFELYGKNLADSRGITGYSNANTPDNGGEITLQQPRTIGATIDLRF